MPQGAISSEGSGGENIQHFSTIRIRATGQGLLRVMVYALDYEKRKELVPIPLKTSPRIQPNRLVNFVEQRAAFELAIIEGDEYFRINRIIVFMKEIFTSHPGA